MSTRTIKKLKRHLEQAQADRDLLSGELAQERGLRLTLETELATAQAALERLWTTTTVGDGLGGE